MTLRGTDFMSILHFLVRFLTVKHRINMGRFRVAHGARHSRPGALVSDRECTQHFTMILLHGISPCYRSIADYLSCLFLLLFSFLRFLFCCVVMSLTSVLKNLSAKRQGSERIQSVSNFPCYSVVSNGYQNIGLGVPVHDTKLPRFTKTEPRK